MLSAVLCLTPCAMLCHAVPCRAVQSSLYVCKFMDAKGVGTIGDALLCLQWCISKGVSLSCAFAALSLACNWHVLRCFSQFACCTACPPPRAIRSHGLFDYGLRVRRLAAPWSRLALAADVSC